MATRYLTKSRFKLALSCPSKLYSTGRSQYAITNDGNDFIESHQKNDSFPITLNFEFNNFANFCFDSKPTASRGPVN